MPASGSGVPTDAPPLLPPTSGLLAQFPPRAASGDHWLTGQTFSPESGTALELTDVCRDTYALSEAPTLRPARDFDPFAVVLREQCSDFGWQHADYVDRASRALAVRRHFAVEREFEQGALNSANPHLAATYTTPTAPSATLTLASGARVSPLDGFCLLEEAIGAAGVGRCVIHATTFLVAQWTHLGLLRHETMEGDEGVGKVSRILSPNGNVVIGGGGYQGRGPDGNVPASHASQWAYATDWLAVEASAPETSPKTLAEATQKERNLVTFRQDQFFTVRWSGLLHTAVLIATTTATVA